MVVSISHSLTPYFSVAHVMMYSDWRQAAGTAVLLGIDSQKKYKAEWDRPKGPRDTSLPASPHLFYTTFYRQDIPDSWNAFFEGGRQYNAEQERLGKSAGVNPA